MTYANVTVGFRDNGPFRAEDPEGVVVSLSSAGYGGNYSIRLSIPELDYQETTHVDLPSFGKTDVAFTIKCPLSETTRCNIIADVFKDGNQVSSRRIQTDTIPLFSFDLLSEDLMQDICNTISATTTVDVESSSIFEDVESLYEDLSFIQPRLEERGRYLNLTSPELLPQFGDGTKDDISICFAKMMYSKGYHCCLIRPPDGIYVGISNSPEQPEISALLNDYTFLRPSDARDGINLNVSIDMAKSVIRPFLKVARKNKDFGFI